MKVEIQHRLQQCIHQSSFKMSQRRKRIRRINNAWETVNTFTEEEGQMLSEGLSTVTELEEFLEK